MDRLLDLVLTGGLRPPLFHPDVLALDRQLPRSEMLALVLLQRHGERTMSELAEVLGAPLCTVSTRRSSGRRRRWTRPPGRGRAAHPEGRDGRGQAPRADRWAPAAGGGGADRGGAGPARGPPGQGVGSLPGVDPGDVPRHSVPEDPHRRVVIFLPQYF